MTVPKEDTKRLRGRKKEDKGDERGDRKNDQLLREEESFKTFLERNQVGDHGDSSEFKRLFWGSKSIYQLTWKKSSNFVHYNFISL